MQGRTTAAPAALNAATKQIRSYAADAKASPTEVSSILEQRIRGVQEESGLAETGRVLSVGYVSPSSWATISNGWVHLAGPRADGSLQ